MAHSLPWRCSNAPAEFVRSRTEGPNRPGPQTALGRVARTKQIVQIADLKTEPQYKAGDPFAVLASNFGGIRTLVSVPMLKDGELIGAINIYRQEVRALYATSRSSCCRTSPPRP